MSHSSVFHIALLIYDNMNKSSENSKKGSSKKVSKAIGRLKNDRFNSSKGATTQADTYARASVLGRTYVSRINNLEIKKSVDDSGSNTNEDWRTFIMSGGWTVDQV